MIIVLMTEIGSNTIIRNDKDTYYQIDSNLIAYIFNSNAIKGGSTSSFTYSNP